MNKSDKQFFLWEQGQNLPLSIKFFLSGYPKEVKDSYPIYAQIILNRKKTVISLKISATPSDWDFDNELFFSAQTKKSAKQFNLVRNNKLQEIRKSFIQSYYELKGLGIIPTVKAIKEAHKGQTVESPKMKFLEYYQIYVEEIKQRPNEYKSGVLEHYNKTLTHLVNFLNKMQLQDISLNQLTRKFIERFENYLLSTPNKVTGRAMNRNTCSTYLKKIKAVINAAIRRELLTTNPFAGFKIKNHRSVNRTFLNMEEIELLKNHDLGGNLSLQRVLDCFLFACYTGIRYSDLSKLTGKMVKKDANGLLWIALQQQKTGEDYQSPMLDYAIEIYNKYEANRKSTGLILPMLTNQKVNTALKVIANLVGIDKNVTFHASRHTFATTITLEQGVDLLSVSALLGHSSISSTQIYAKMTRNKKVDVINFLNEKNRKTETL